MGAAESIPQVHESDPWWPNEQQQDRRNSHNVAAQDTVPGITEQEESPWLKLQDLSKTDQQQENGELDNLRTLHLQQQLAIKKYEVDVAEYHSLVTSLQDKLKITEKERNEATNSNRELIIAMKELQQEHQNNEQENKRLQEQLVLEKMEQQHLLIENRRQAALLENNASGTEEAEGGTSLEPEADITNIPRTPSPKATAELEKFREQMKTKREARHQALQAISNEMERLRAELSAEQTAKCEALKQLEEIQAIGAENHMRTQLEESTAILNRKTEECQQLEFEREKYQTQIAALKEVVALSKQMLNVRENQVAQLKQSLKQIEGTVMGDKNKGPITVELKAEYESQMRNIKDLKALYEERMKVIHVEKEKLLKEHAKLTEDLDYEKKKSAEYEEQIKELEIMISERNTTVSDLQDQLSESLDQSRNLSNELALINNIFTQMLVGSDTDLDKLIKVLQDNHDLMTEITTNEDCDETAASLPKLLLNLISQVNTSGNEEASTSNEASGIPVPQENVSIEGETNRNLDAQEIASKLPKVWKVLLELISQQIVPTAVQDSKDGCYNSIETPNGPRLVISVSKTFIRLKDLILEKKSLQKELSNLKQLNGHLEGKLIQQERRLSLVSSELRKTWSVVGRMRNQYQQLHTHEKVLRYELQQKRKLLNELKEELEYCREKWVEARKKNSQSEVEWRKLRKEFSSRKKEVEDSFNNSGESGYSDEKGDDSGDDDTGQRQSPVQALPSQDSFPTKVLDNSEDLAVSPDEILSDIENTEDSSSSSKNSSLPDLVSVATDTNMPSPLLTNELFSEQTSETSPLQSEQTGNECPTVSLITSIKEQLSCFSKDLHMITANLEFSNNVKAIQSIFSLPAIEIPEHLMHDLQCKATKDTYRSPEPSQSHTSRSNECRNPEEVLDARAARLKRLEEQSQQLFNKITRTTYRSTALSNRLEELHEQYGTTKPNGNIPEPPPLPNTPLPQTSRRSPEEILEARAARLTRLEEQCQQLFNRVTRTTERSTTLSNQLDELHQQYGPQETSVSSGNIPPPPPIPEVIPSMRIPTSSEDDFPETQHESLEEDEENT